MDLSVYHSLNEFAYRHAAVGELARFFAGTALFIVVGALALVCLPAGRRALPRDRRAIAAGAASGVLAILLAVAIGDVWNRARPFVHHPHHLLVAHAPDASFPSDHVSFLAAIAVALLLRRRRLGWAVLAAAILVAGARVMVGVHYPTDVLGGMVCGALAALVLGAGRVRALLDGAADRLGAGYDGMVARVQGASGRRATAGR